MRKLEDAKGKIMKPVNGIAEGGGDSAEFKEALIAEREQPDGLQHEFQEVKAGNVITQVLKIVESYQQEVAQLTTALTIDDGTRLNPRS